MVIGCTFGNEETVCRLVRRTFVRSLNIFPLCRVLDRPLDAREKPALIQRRRLIQAGYEAIDGLDELGKEDMSMLCKFIFRLPQLPGIVAVSDRLTWLRLGLVN